VAVGNQASNDHFSCGSEDDLVLSSGATLLSDGNILKGVDPIRSAGGIRRRTDRLAPCLFLLWSY